MYVNDVAVIRKRPKLEGTCWSEMAETWKQDVKIGEK